MKEAAGEANMTVITIVLIAVVLGVGTFIVNNLMETTSLRSACTSAGGTLSGKTCTVDNGSGSSTQLTCSCTNNKCSCQ